MIISIFNYNYYFYHRQLSRLQTKGCHLYYLYPLLIYMLIAILLYFSHNYQSMVLYVLSLLACSLYHYEMINFIILCFIGLSFRLICCLFLLLVFCLQMQYICIYPEYYLFSVILKNQAIIF